MKGELIEKILEKYLFSNNKECSAKEESESVFVLLQSFDFCEKGNAELPEKVEDRKVETNNGISIEDVPF